MRIDVKLTFKIVLILIICIAIIPQTFRAIIYPKNYNKYVQEAAKTFSLDEHLIYSIIKIESNFDKNAISTKGAKGLMQIMDATSLEMNSRVSKVIDASYNVKKDIYMPELNILLGSAYLKQLMTKYNNNYKLVLAAYNAGMGNVDKWIKEETIDITKDNFYETIPFKETKEYVIKGIRTRNMYDFLY